MATIFTFTCVLVFSFALLAISIDGRKDLEGKYWRNVKHDQALLSGTSNKVLNVDVILPVSVEEKADCNSMDELAKNMEHKKHNNFVKGSFEPRPNTWIYDDKLKAEEKRSFTNEFETRPNISIYDKEGRLSVNKVNEFLSNEFEPRPNISSYRDDSDNNGLKEEKKFVDDFEPRPNISIYHD